MPKAFPAVALAALFALASPAWAAGPYDGVWNGQVSKGLGRCGPASISVQVQDGTVAGTVRRNSGDLAVAGQVAADGTFTGLAGRAELTGTFAGNAFTGSYRSPDCGTRTITLDRAQ